MPELFDKPIRVGDYDTSLNYRVEDEHQFGESSTAGMVRGAILKANARPTIPFASNRPERSTPRRERRQSSERASTERSITPYHHYVPYRNPNPLEFRGLADERSGEISPYNIVQECGSLLSPLMQVITKASIIYCENLAVIPYSTFVYVSQIISGE